MSVVSGSSLQYVSPVPAKIFLLCMILGAKLLSLQGQRAKCSSLTLPTTLLSSKQGCAGCRGQQGIDPAWRARQKALEYEGLQKFSCMAKRLPHPARQCAKQTVCHHELVDNHNIWAGPVTMVIAATIISFATTAMWSFQALLTPVACEHLTGMSLSSVWVLVFHT